MSPATPRPGSRERLRAAFGRPDGQLPVLDRLFPRPLAAKVPEIIALFWVVKILTTAGGEATSDYLKTYGNFGAGGIEIVLILVGLAWQFSTRRYQAFAYWFLAYAVATTGTGVADFIHLDLHIPYIGTTILWAAVLAAVFWGWQRSEGTLSIHSIVIQRREAFYWAAVFATFALGTALGDLTAISFNWGYLSVRAHFRGDHPAPCSGQAGVWTEQHRCVLDVLRCDASARRFVCGLDRQAEGSPGPWCRRRAHCRRIRGGGLSPRRLPGRCAS